MGMELALLYILSVLLDEALTERRRAADMQRLALALQAGNTPLESAAVLPLALNATHAATGFLEPELPTPPWKLGHTERNDPLGSNATRAHVHKLESLHSELVKVVNNNKAAVAQELEAQAFTHRWQ
ncbi:MAG: hypothetical protein SGPRY_015029, partial [Prymnesium sp.]